MSPSNICTNISSTEPVTNPSLVSISGAPVAERREESPNLSAKEDKIPSQVLIQAEPDEAEAIRLVIRAETAPVGMVPIFSFYHCMF